MYGKFSVRYKITPEKATVIPQYQQTPVEDEYRPTYENTLPGITNIATPMAKSTPVLKHHKHLCYQMSPYQKEIWWSWCQVKEQELHV